MAQPSGQLPFNEKNRQHSTSDESSTSANGPVKEHPATHFSSKNQVIDLPASESDKIELSEEDCYDELGFSFSSTKKWLILTVIFLVQTSMNFNTSLYSNAIGGISKEYQISEQAARVGAAIFLVTYAFGCELWVSYRTLILRVTPYVNILSQAPWSEGKHFPRAGEEIPFSGTNFA